MEVMGVNDANCDSSCRRFRRFISDGGCCRIFRGDLRGCHLARIRNDGDVGWYCQGGLHEVCESHNTLKYNSCGRCSSAVRACSICILNIKTHNRWI